MDSQDQRDALLDLADRQFSGTATPQELRELERLLLDHPERQQVYLKHALLHGQMGLIGLTLAEASEWGRQAVGRAGSSAAPGGAAVSVNRSIGAGVEAGGRPGRMLHRVRHLSLAVVIGAGVFLLLLPQWTAQRSHRTDDPDGVVTEHGGGTSAGPDSGSAYDNRRLPMEVVGTFEDQPVGRRTVLVENGESRFVSAGGADVRVSGPGAFGVDSAESGVLYTGSVHARVLSPDTRFAVVASNLRILDQGTEFQVTRLDGDSVQVKVLDGAVDVQSRTRRPLFFWDFDDAGGEEAWRLSSGKAAESVTGLVGRGAVRFDNTSASYLEVPEGTGPKVGTGTMAFSSGITIEVLVVSRWSGAYRDYDEIFRKEDGVNRILLSFQNDDDVGDYDNPEVTPGPCLSFGLATEEAGYSELDMPLDGRDGRPRLDELTDGELHHIVALYDSFTGRRAICVDGRVCFEHVQPVGRLILSGGPVPAVIGNTANRSEPFRGVIDELALYDFALSDEEIERHWRNVQAGRHYFDGPAADTPGEQWRSVMLMTAGTSRVFSCRTGLPIASAGQ